jgi:hypothetical protein
MFTYSIFASDGWKKSVNAGDTIVWKNSSFPKTYISVTKSEGENKLAHEIVTEDLVRIQYQKKALLNLVGVHNWRIQNFKWDPKKRVLNSYGFYTDNKGIEVYFREKHIYAKGSTIQYLVTTNRKNSKIDIHQVLSSFLSSESN